MYDIAANFGTNKEASGRAFTTLESTLKELKIYAHVTRIMVKDDYYLSFIYDGKESDLTLYLPTIEGILSQGILCKLPPETIATIQQRRAERRAKGVGTFESHDATEVRSRTPILRDAETHETMQVFNELTEIIKEEPYTDGPAPGSIVHPIGLKDVPPELRKQAAQAQAEVQRKQKEKARPFFIRFRSNVEQLYEAEGDEGFDPALSIYIEQLHTMTPYLFTESAVKLFQAVWEPKEDFPTPYEDIWIEFYTPLETPHGVVKAIAISQSNQLAAIKQLERKMPGLKGLSETEGFKERYLYRVQVLDDAMDHISTENYDTDLKRWLHLPGTTEESKLSTAWWASWVRTLLLMIDREYATAPEPIPWQTQKIAYEEEGVERVGKGKNRRIIRAIHKRDIEYKIISFDVSVPAPARDSRRQEETPEEERRQNWLILHGKEQRIYKKVHFEDNARRYVGEYYRRLIERCVQLGGEYTEEGRKYKLERTEEGEHYVVSTIADFDKYVPMLRPEYRRQVIKKVIASQVSSEKERK